jgi:hypothetical protein
MPHDAPPSHEPLTPADPDDRRLIADLQALYAAPPVPDHLRQHGAEQVRAQFAQRSAQAPSRFWGISIPRGEPLPRATAFAAIAAVALVCLLAVALLQPGLSGLSGFPGGLRPHPTSNSAQATQTAEASNGIPPVQLSTVAMVSATDGWAFGTSVHNGCLVLHYDGQSWKRRAGSACGYVSSISMVSADDGWALAIGYDPANASQEILHYTHGAWQVQTTFPTPNQATPQANQGQEWSTLRSIGMVSPTEGWAVGATEHQPTAVENPLILHYAHGQWTPTSIVGLPAGIASGGVLQSISMFSPTEGWAVGFYYGFSVGLPAYTYMLVLHDHNGAWSYVNWTHAGALNGVDALPTGDMWAVGAVTGVGPSAVVHLHDGAFAGLLETVPGSLNAVQIFATPSGWNGWAVGDGAATVHDQDSVWTREGYTIHGYTITSMSLLSPAEGWAVGMNDGSGSGEYLKPNWTATLFHLHNGIWSIYPLAGF